MRIGNRLILNVKKQLRTYGNEELNPGEEKVSCVISALAAGTDVRSLHLAVY